MRPPTKKQYIREQKTICGKNYAEVDFCWISEKEHRAGTRGRKRFASSLAQQGRNAERARRTLVQLLNTNFDEQGFSTTLTYEDIYLPGGDDAAWLDVQNYLQRIRRWLKKQKWPNAGKLKWVCVTENQKADPAHGLKEVRYHHHMVLQVDGLTPEQRAALRDALENLWSTGTNRYREPLGTVNADRLQPEHDSLEGLAKYLLKSPRRKKRWHASRGLERPAYPRPNDTHWTPRKLADACTTLVDDAGFWERRYPGYRFLGAVPSFCEERAEWRLCPGIETVEVRQHSDTLHMPTKLFCELVESGRLAYVANRLFEVNVENAKCTYDTNMNRYVNKKRSNGKVDCVMAVIDGLYLLQQNEMLDDAGSGFVCQVG